MTHLLSVHIVRVTIITALYILNRRLFPYMETLIHASCVLSHAVEFELGTFVVVFHKGQDFKEVHKLLILIHLLKCIWQVHLLWGCKVMFCRLVHSGSESFISIWCVLYYCCVLSHARFSYKGRVWLSYKGKIGGLFVLAWIESIDQEISLNFQYISLHLYSNILNTISRHEYYIVVSRFMGLAISQASILIGECN